MNTSTQAFAKLIADLKRHRDNEQRLIERLAALTKTQAAPEYMKCLFKLANDAFGENAAKFLILPNRSLGDMPPIMVAQSGEGINEVEVLLKRILYGVYG